MKRSRVRGRGFWKTRFSRRCCCRTSLLLLLLFLLFSLTLTTTSAKPLLFFLSPFGFLPTWIFDGKWEDIVFIFTLYPTWSCDQQTKWKDIWVKALIDGLEASFLSSDSCSRKWFPLFHSHIIVFIFAYCNKGFIFSYIYIYIYIIGFLSFEIIDYHYYHWLIG